VRVVIAHDFFETFGGAERVTAEIAAAFPDAPVYAILGRRSVAARMGIEGRIFPVLPAHPRLLKHYRWLASAYPVVVSSARLPPADVIVSSSYAYAHGFQTENRAPKLCYHHGPFRHLWQPEAYMGSLPGGVAGRAAFSIYSEVARRLDRKAAASVGSFLTQSPFTAEMIQRVYRRRAQVVPPPVDCHLFSPSEAPAGGYFLFVGRLVEAYKRPSLAVEAFARMPDLKLLIAGDGPARADLEAKATSNVRFLGALRDQDLVRVMQRCDAAVFPSVDDFGLVPLEVNACGRPVLALRAGGALHTVRPGLSGEFIREQSVDELVRAVRGFDGSKFDGETLRNHALRWSAHTFRERLRAAVEEAAGSGKIRIA
jgi:glycosyltransferase involved in cell wall biosynthesis